MSVLSSLFHNDEIRMREGRLFELRDLLIQPRGANEARIRALCGHAYLGGGRAVARVLGRYKMFVDTADLGHSPHLMLDGYWEMWTTEAIAGAVRPGMTCVDVGANLGYFTLLMAEMAGAGGSVHAFEPNPPIADRLRDTIALNGFDDRTHIYEVPLGSQEGAAVHLIVPRNEPKNAHVIAVDDQGQAQFGDVMHTRRLDGFPELATADVIKIDADTAEEAIWDGMSGLFATGRSLTIFLEFASARYRDPESFLARIQANGFALSRLDLDQGTQQASHASILAAPPTIDQMLVLKR